MSGILNPESSSAAIQTLDRSDIALSFRRRLTVGEKTVETPTKAIPASKLYHDNQVLEETRGVNEFYKQVDAGDLLQAPTDGLLHISGLEKQLRWSREDEIDFAFLEYTDNEQISKIEAYQLVGILDRASDYLTVPLQSELYHEIEEDSELDDLWYQKLYNGTELFLRACHEYDTEKPIMGGIPPLDLPHLEDLINLYEQYDVFAFYFDFDWNLPTTRDKVNRIAYFLRRIANQRHHNDLLLYAINARSGTFDGSIGYRPAADFAPALMGFDIIGENHSGPTLDPDDTEEIERREDFRMFKRDMSGYIDSPVDNLEKHFPDRTNVNIGEILQRTPSDTAKRRFEKFVNAEQIELLLAELREALREGNSSEFVETNTPSSRAISAGRSVREAFTEGLQTELGDYT